MGHQQLLLVQHSNHNAVVLQVKLLYQQCYQMYDRGEILSPTSSYSNELQQTRAGPQTLGVWNRT